MYCGFLQAKLLAEITEVPSFSRTKGHKNIAETISSPPIDEWQRPLEDNKVNQIKDTYSMSTKTNLMSNPILLGENATNSDSNVGIRIEQKTILTQRGEVIPIDNLFSIKVRYTESKPIWILDGQHRVLGISRSTQQSEPIPFVLLANKDIYPAPMLAEIFTQVTTTATPLENLHSEWLRYAFSLEKYQNSTSKQAMATVVYLCKEASFNGSPNVLLNRIQFNPYMTSNSYFAFGFNAIEWEKMIEEYYYGSGGNLPPIDVAEQIVLSTIAFKIVDRWADPNTGSKLFSTSNTHKMLAEAYLYGLFQHLIANPVPKSLSDWVAFFKSPNVAFDKCDWRLNFVASTGSLSSTNSKISKELAKECFNYAMNNPSVLNGNLLTDFLQGVGSKFKITAYVKSARGAISHRNSYQKSIDPGNMKPFSVCDGGFVRDIIRVESLTPNCHVVEVYDPEVNPERPLPSARQHTGLDISGFPSGKKISVHTMSYSGDTRTVTTIRLDK